MESVNRVGWESNLLVNSLWFVEYLNNYKIPFALTPSQLGSETVRCIIPHDITVDSALSVDGLGIIEMVIMSFLH